MSTAALEGSSVPVRKDLHMNDEQKRMLRAVRRGYRAEGAEIKDNGWDIVITYMDGSKVTVNAKMLKLKHELLG
jgi:hypothetical protein